MVKVVAQVALCRKAVHKKIKIQEKTPVKRPFLQSCTLENLNRSSHRKYSVKTAILKNFVIFIGKHLLGSLYNIDGMLIFSNEYCETFKITFFEEHLQAAASDVIVNFDK